MAFPLAEGITDPPVIALTCLALALLIRYGGALAAGRGPRGGLRDEVHRLAGLGRARRHGHRDATVDAPRPGSPPPRLVPRPGLPRRSPRPGSSTRRRSWPTPWPIPSGSPPPARRRQARCPATCSPRSARPGTRPRSPCCSWRALALVASLIIAPPRTPAEAAKRIALGLTALFALSPATRFGYFCYPLALYGWVALAGYRARGLRQETRPPAEPRLPARLGYRTTVGVR